MAELKPAANRLEAYWRNRMIDFVDNYLEVAELAFRDMVSSIKLKLTRDCYSVFREYIAI